MAEMRRASRQESPVVQRIEHNVASSVEVQGHGGDVAEGNGKVAHQIERHGTHGHDEHQKVECDLSTGKTAGTHLTQDTRTLTPAKKMPHELSGHFDH